MEESLQADLIQEHCFFSDNETKLHASKTMI